MDDNNTSGTVTSSLPASLDMHDQAEPLLVRTDAAFRILDWAGDPAVYDFNPQAGEDIRGSMKFLVGLDGYTSVTFPMMWFNGNRPIHVSVMAQPQHAQAYVLLTDANATDMADLHLRKQVEKNEIAEYRASQLESELQTAKREAARASELKSRFIAGMSHEFRTPVTSVLGYCDLLEKDYGREDRRLQGIRRSATHLLSLVENLLEHGRVVSDRIEPVEEDVNLRRLFESMNLMFEPLAQQKELAFEIVEQGCACEEIRTDPVRLRQIIVNLISNALRYTDSGSVKVTWSQANDRLKVSVIDTGPGIPEDKRQHIFQAFSSLEDENTRAKGLGLGLSISQHLADVLGGGIELESTVGEGSVFSFDVRAAGVLAANIAPTSDNEGQRRVLIVEDDMDVREFLAVILADLGYAPTLAINGQQALDKLATARPDVVLSDFHLNDISGEKLILDIRSNDIPVIAMSASNAEEDRNAAFDAGCSAYLVKPFELDVLGKELDKAING
ncbi:MAG: hybrid sensor histidine kinase/response regulator [Lysobacterales bacterium]